MPTGSEGLGGGGGESLLKTPSSPLPRRGSYTRCLSHAHDELKSFRSCLRWMCVDHSDTWRMIFSWSLFLLLSIVVPIASHFLMSYSDASRQAYDLVVQLSLTFAASISYVCLSNFVRRYGLRRFLFLDKLVGESEHVRQNYTTQLNRSFKIQSYFVMPCFIAEVLYKIFWYATSKERIPEGAFLFFGSFALTEVVTGVLELASWIYRTAIFFLVCVLFRLICFLQILRLDDFAASFQQAPDVGSVLREHFRIRKQLKIISHRYRSFIVNILLLVTGSQFVVLFLTTRPRALVNLSNAGELAVSSLFHNHKWPSSCEVFIYHVIVYRYYCYPCSIRFLCRNRNHVLFLNQQISFPDCNFTSICSRHVFCHVNLTCVYMVYTQVWVPTFSRWLNHKAIKLLFSAS